MDCYLLSGAVYHHAIKSFNGPFPHITPWFKEQDIFLQAQFQVLFCTNDLFCSSRPHTFSCSSKYGFPANLVALNMGLHVVCDPEKTCSVDSKDPVNALEG